MKTVRMAIFKKKMTTVMNAAVAAEQMTKMTQCCQVAHQEISQEVSHHHQNGICFQYHAQVWEPDADLSRMVG